MEVPRSTPLLEVVGEGQRDGEGVEVRPYGQMWIWVVQVEG